MQKPTRKLPPAIEVIWEMSPRQIVSALLKLSPVLAEDE